MKIGILALQGAVGPHVEKLRQLQMDPVEVRHPEELKALGGIILPGGESTTMLHLLHLNQLWEPLKRFVREKPAMGVCAGAILLAKTVHSPEQESLSAMDIEIQRNAYGRQLNSFIDAVQPTEYWIDRESMEGVFIRAPRILSFSGRACPLLQYAGEPVMVEEGNLIAVTFHPELTNSTKVHEFFLRKCEGYQRG